jgi:hypothetical protein
MIYNGYIYIMSGVYNYWYKVNNPTSENNITPMKSGGFQKPFYFGGSQVPEMLNLNSHEINGKGINRKINFKPEIRGKISQSTQRDIGNVHIPRHLTLK